MSGRETGAWPTRRSAVLDWLVHETRGQPFADNLFGELCDRLVAEGVPLARAVLRLRTLHPQYMGASFFWERGRTGTEVRLATHDIVATPQYLSSPIRALFEGAEAIRQRLDLPVSGPAYAIYDDLRAEGMTDYLALTMVFTSGQRQALTWMTDRPGGFVTADIRPLGETDGLDFCRRLPRLAGVVAVPTQVFYDDVDAGRPLIRFAFCKRDDVIDEAVDRLRRLGGDVAA